MSTPIYNRLNQYKNMSRVPFAMPGHKNGRGIKEDLFMLDVTELDKTLNLRAYDNEYIASAQKQLADLYGADESFIITCGATAGVQAMLSAVLTPGDTLLASADCHMSVINTCALCGFKLRFIPTGMDSESLITYDDGDIENILDLYDDAAALLITSPNYYGICRNVKRYAKACHDRGIPLLVDEAHGAHFAASGRFPKSAVCCGADAAVNSAHKTLNALTGAAYLHLSGNRINHDRIKAALGMFQTSSPSYPIAASADIARDEIEKYNEWDRLIDICIRFRKEINERLFIRVVDNDDPTRLVLNFAIYDTTGFEVKDILSERYNIDAEMADMVNVVFIITPSNTKDDFDRLYNALKEISDVMGVRREPISILPPPERKDIITPQRAFYAVSQRLPIDKCFNRISSVTVTAYPPGIPIICAGEKITSNHILYIRHLKKRGAVFTGFDGSTFIVI